MESALVNVAVGLIAAGVGVFAGVRVHEAQIEDITKRLDRIENKVDWIMRKWGERDR